jgi:hypothetical protein
VGPREQQKRAASYGATSSVLRLHSAVTGSAPPGGEKAPTISTICSSVQYLRSSANISSVTAVGTEAAARAKSSVARSAAL